MTFSLIVRTAEEVTADALTAAKGAALSRVLAWSDAAASPLVSGVSDLEVMSWPSKFPAAKAYLAGNACVNQTCMIEGEASLTGETCADLCARIVAKAQSYHLAASIIAGVRRHVDDLLMAAETPEACAAAADAAIAAAQAALDAGM